MHQSPSIIPPGADNDIYLVLDEFGNRLGRAWRDTDEEDTDRETLLRHLMEGQYRNPVRIVSFNTGEGWSRDASEDVALELARRVDGACREISETLREFIESNSGRPIGVQMALPLNVLK
jgi:hypothetical protein